MLPLVGHSFSVVSFVLPIPDSPQRSLVVSPALIWIFVSFVVLIFCASDVVTAVTPSLTFDCDGIQCVGLGPGNCDRVEGLVVSQWSDLEKNEWISQKFMLSDNLNFKLSSSSGRFAAQRHEENGKDRVRTA